MHGLHGTYHMVRNPFGRTTIELLDDMCYMESRFGLCGDRVSFGARWVHSLCLMILLGKGAQVEAQFAFVWR